MLFRSMTWLPIGIGDTICNSEKHLTEKLDRLVYHQRDPEINTRVARKYNEVVDKYLVHLLSYPKCISETVPSWLRNLDEILKDHSDGFNMKLTMLITEHYE